MFTVLSQGTSKLILMKIQFSAKNISCIKYRNNEMNCGDRIQYKKRYIYYYEN